MPLGLLFILLGFAGLFFNFLIFANWRAFWDMQEGFYRSRPHWMRWLFWNQHRWWPGRIDPFMRWGQSLLALTACVGAIILGFTLLLG